MRNFSLLKWQSCGFFPVLQVRRWESMGRGEGLVQKCWSKVNVRNTRGRGRRQRSWPEASRELEKEEMQVGGKEGLDCAAPQRLGFASFALDKLRWMFKFYYFWKYLNLTSCRLLKFWMYKYMWVHLQTCTVEYIMLNALFRI